MKSLKLIFVLGMILVSMIPAQANILVKDQGESSKIKCNQERDIGNLTNDLELISETLVGKNRELIFKVHFKSCQKIADNQVGFRDVAFGEIFEQKIQGNSKLWSMSKTITYARFFHTHTGSMDQYSDVSIKEDQYILSVAANAQLKKLILGPVVTSSVYNNEDYYQEDYIDFGPAKEVLVIE